MQYVSRKNGGKKTTPNRSGVPECHNQNGKYVECTPSTAPRLSPRSDNGGKHDKKVCQYVHWNICREYGMDGLPKEWYDHIPNPVTTVGPCTILYDQQIHTDGTVCQPTNRISSCGTKWCKLIEASVPAEKDTPDDSQRRRQQAEMWKFGE